MAKDLEITIEISVKEYRLAIFLAMIKLMYSLSLYNDKNILEILENLDMNFFIKTKQIKKKI